MSATSPRHFPGPAQTPIAPPPLARRHLLHPDALSDPLVARQIADQAAIENAMTQCQIFSGNAVISCYPTADTVVLQNEWATFVWNSRRPELTQFNRVNIYLFHADSLQPVLSINDYINPTDRAGVVRANVNDTWWGPSGSRWSPGRNISYPFYWVITRADETLSGSELPQSTFTAIQTTYADSVVSSMASTSAAAASSLASASVASAASASSVAASRSASASVRPSLSSGSFPHWAIAVIVILGFFALSAFFVFAFFLIRKFRRQNQSSGSNRNSMGSASPMMADIGNSPQSPLLTTAGPTAPSATAHHAPSIVSPDGASTLSRDPSTEAGPFSGADAAIMADAFRKALRKPGFPDLPVEEDSPDSRERKEELLNRELAEEGRDIRNVSSSRGVKVETPPID